MQLACQEALAANAVPAARAALFKLLGILQQEQQQQAPAAAATAGDVEPAVSTKAGSNSSSSSAGRVSEGWVLRALVKLDSDEIDRHVKLLQAANARAAAAAASADGDSSESRGSQQNNCGKATAAAQTLQQEQGGEACAAQGQPGSNAAAAAAKCAAQLSEVLQAAVSRARALGLEALSGDKEAEGCRLLEWMSSMAWNAALQVTGRANASHTTG